jgi:putative ABC transport system ATP-binding protein
MPILEGVHLCKEYGAPGVRVGALRGVDMQAEPGEFLAIMGPSGCGKSTLLHLLGGIEPPTSGQVWLDAQELSALGDAERSIIRRRRIGFVFQRMNLLGTLTAVDNVALPLRIDGIARAAARVRALEALENVGLAPRINQLPHQLSGGEQQRVAIARALVTRPAVLLADEPTGALDSQNGQHILDLLRERANQGQTVVMVTHDATLAQQADRILAMRDGQIASESSPNSLEQTAGGR